VKSILDFVPNGFKLRPLQTNMLLDVEAAWVEHDVIVVEGDVGSGKSLVIQTIARWQASLEKTTATITPRVALQDQYKDSFKDVPLLKGAGRYPCQEKGVSSCSSMKTLMGSYCETGCKYVCAKVRAKESLNTIYNLQSYLFSKDTRDIVLVDEAHTLLDQLSETQTLNIWKHRYNYPDGLDLNIDIMVWLESMRDVIEVREAELREQIAAERSAGGDEETLTTLNEDLSDYTREKGKFFNIYQGLKSKDGNYFLEHTEDHHRGKLKPLIRIRPKSLKGLYNPLLAKGTSKIILATATLIDLEVERLGLSHKRVKYLEYPSTFALEDQPIIVDPVGNMGYKYQDKNIPKLAQRIRDTRALHPDTKGVVHMTYGMANKLKKYLNDDGIMYHDSKNKEKVLKAFKDSTDKVVLVACGMSMGVDLPGPSFGWQAISKIMYPNQGDALIKHWYTSDKKWICWLTAREFVQACGRINRYHGDKGTTYIWDSCIGNIKRNRFGLVQNAIKFKYFKPHFLRRIAWK
jgi:Rad3-related DNA helicase